MKVRVELEVDLTTGSYDVQFHNLSRPGDDIDLQQVNRVVIRVLDNVAAKMAQPKPATGMPHKLVMN